MHAPDIHIRLSVKVKRSIHYAPFACTIQERKIICHVQEFTTNTHDFIIVGRSFVCFRLHLMREMRTIDDHPRHLSVCLTFDFTQTQLNGSRSCLGRRLLGHKEHCIRRESRFPLRIRCGLRQIILATCVPTCGPVVHAVASPI